MRAGPVERLQVIDIVRLKSRVGNIRRGCEWSQEKQIFHFHRDQQTFCCKRPGFLLIFCEIFIIRLWMNARKSFGRGLSKQNNAKSEARIPKVLEWVGDEKNDVKTFVTGFYDTWS